MRQLFVLSLLISLAACSPDAELEEPFQEDRSDDGARVLANATIQYEGSCEFLMNCSVWSGEGEVNWGCGGSDCTAQTPYIAAPSSYAGMCGEDVTVCLQGTDTCTTAIIKDMSCCNRWEAGPSVLDALGVSYGENIGACSGYGEANVTIYQGAGGVPVPVEGEFNGTYCTSSGNSCDGNEPCWADCPGTSTCDFANGTWGFCIE